jgi:hypothetical protein
MSRRALVQEYFISDEDIHTRRNKAQLILILLKKEHVNSPCMDTCILIVDYFFWSITKWFMEHQSSINQFQRNLLSIYKVDNHLSAFQLEKWLRVIQGKTNSQLKEMLFKYRSRKGAKRRIALKLNIDSSKRCRYMNY